MKLRNGIETNKSLLVYFPEDVWHMILHKYLDIENYWRKCHMKYLRIFKPIQDDYVAKMCRMFCDNCSEYVKKCPTSYGADNKWKVKKRIKIITKIYEELIKYWSVLMLQLRIDEKRARHNTEINRLMDVLSNKTTSLKFEIQREKQLSELDLQEGKYYSYDNEMLMNVLLEKLAQFDKIYNENMILYNNNLNL